MKTYTLQDIDAKGAMLDGKIVKVSFCYRDSAIDKADKEGFNTGRLFASLDSNGYGSADVIFPSQALPWFTRLTINYASRTPQFVICRIQRNHGFQTLELLGRSVNNGFTETKIVW